MIDTDEALLDRVRDLPAHDAWREFYDAYWSPIVRYAMKMGLDRHSAEEVLQETMVDLIGVLPRFIYDRRKGRFRNFLLTIVHRESLEAVRRARRGEEMEVSLDERRDDGRPLVEELPAAESVDVEAAEVRERWRRSIAEDALARVKDDSSVDARTRAVFEAYVIRRRPVQEICAEFGLGENAVYQIKSRIVRRLRVQTERRMRESGSGR